MKLSLYKGLDDQGKADVKSAFLSGLPFRKQLVTVLYDKIEVKRKKMAKESLHDEGGDWALKMADAMGYERSMREFIDLLSEKSENK